MCEARVCRKISSGDSAGVCSAGASTAGTCTGCSVGGVMVLIVLLSTFLLILHFMVY